MQSKGTDGFTKSRNHMQVQETKKVMGNSYVAGNKNIANHNAKMHNNIIVQCMQQKPHLNKH